MLAANCSMTTPLSSINAPTVLRRQLKPESFCSRISCNPSSSRAVVNQGRNRAPSETGRNRGIFCWSKIYMMKARGFRFAKQRAFFLKGISNRVSHITELSFQRGVLLHGKSTRTGSSDVSVTSINLRSSGSSVGSLGGAFGFCFQVFDVGGCKHGLFVEDGGCAFRQECRFLGNTVMLFVFKIQFAGGKYSNLRGKKALHEHLLLCTMRFYFVSSWLCLFIIGSV